MLKNTYNHVLDRLSDDSLELSVRIYYLKMKEELELETLRLMF